MDWGKMKEQLAGVYAGLQQLDLKPTAHNVGILAAAQRSLSELYDRAAEAEKAETVMADMPAMTEADL